MVLISVAVLTGTIVGLGMNALVGRSGAEIRSTLRSTVKTPKKDFWILAAGAIGAALVGLNVGSSYAKYVLAVSLVCISFGAIINRRLLGMSVIALGALMNLIPLLLNGYLPVDPQAFVAAGIADTDSLYRVVLGAGRQLQSSGDLLSGLGPVIGVSWFREVISFGDLVIAAGVCNACFRLLWPADIALRPQTMQSSAERAEVRPEIGIISSAA